jgi:small subunit ribosomal protein S5
MNLNLKSYNLFTKKVNPNLKIIKGNLLEKIIQIRRVTKVTKGGKKLSFRAIIVVGDKKGKVGIGIAKANDVLTALKKAKTNGLKNLIYVPITKSLSIPHNISGYYGSSHILIRPALEGSGVIAGGSVRIVLEIAGIKNIIAKQLGSNNLLNNARATISGLNNLIIKIKNFNN